MDKILCFDRKRKRPFRYNATAKWDNVIKLMKPVPTCVIEIDAADTTSSTYYRLQFAPDNQTVRFFRDD